MATPKKDCSGNGIMNSRIVTPEKQHEPRGLVSRQYITCDGPGCDVTDPKKRCSRCCISYYCSKECQMKHWKVHKTDCVTLDSIVDVDELLKEDDGIDDECGICLERDISHRVVVPGCRHGFCYQCMVDYNQNGEHSERKIQCPLCRNTISVGIVEDILTRAKVDAARSAQTFDPEMKKKNLTSALYEVDKLLSIKQDAFKIRPLTVKAEVYRIVGEPLKALKILEELLEMWEEAKRSAQYFLDKCSECGKTGDLKKLAELQEELRIRREKGGYMISNDIGEQHQMIHVRVLVAKVKGDLGDWEADFKKLCQLTSSSYYDAFETVNKVHIALEFTRAAYGTGRFDNAIEWGLDNIASNRRHPKPYKYVALAYKAKGDFQAAKRMAARGLLYMADEVHPWEHGAKAAELFELYEELCS